jgi:hypothetical protein
VQPGEIYRHAAFYAEPNTGELLPKYLLILAVPHGDDIVARLLTSRAHGRPEHPPCYHGLPYDGFFLGVPGEPLTEKTWVDLRPFNDIDPIEFRRRESEGIVAFTCALPVATVCAVIECVAASEDTTLRQERHLRDTLATLRAAHSGS